MITHATEGTNYRSHMTHYFRSSCANKKLIRRWDSEHELFTTTSYTYYKIQ